MTTTTPTKSDLRTQFRAFRDALSEEAYREKSEAICRRIRTLPELAAAQTVHAYWPQTTEHEIDTRPLIRSLSSRGRRIVLPVVTSFQNDEGAPSMEHRVFISEEQMATNRWGIREPAGTPRVAPDALDLVLTPALGGGRNGHRIGHGRGYYDAFLADVTAPIVALVYADCLVDEVPAEPHDVPASVLVTEHGIIRPTSTA